MCVNIFVTVPESNPGSTCMLNFKRMSCLVKVYCWGLIKEPAKFNTLKFKHIFAVALGLDWNLTMVTPVSLYIPAWRKFIVLWASDVSMQDIKVHPPEYQICCSICLFWCCWAMTTGEWLVNKVVFMPNFKFRLHNMAPIPLVLDESFSLYESFLSFPMAIYLLSKTLSTIEYDCLIWHSDWPS